MKIYESKIFDGVNSVLALIQNKLDVVRQNSFLLLNIDYFILFFLLLTFFVSTFGTTGMIGAVSIFVPLLVVLKTLMTKGQKIEIEQCNFFILIYLLICFISNFTSSLPDKSFYGFSKTFVYIIFYLLRLFFIIQIIAIINVCLLKIINNKFVIGINLILYLTILFTPYEPKRVVSSISNMFLSISDYMRLHYYSNFSLEIFCSVIYIFIPLVISFILFNFTKNKMKNIGA